MSTPFENVWEEPRAPGGAPPRRRDWVLVAVILAASIPEGLWRSDVAWRPLAIGMTVSLALTLPWRRVHPLGTVLATFGGLSVVQLLALARGVDWVVLDTALYTVILPYALLRWGSGREAVCGLAVIALAFVIAVPGVDLLADAIGAGLFLLFPAALGASVRYRHGARRRADDEVRLRERARLARELHDTVAHHVSAIAVQAQAGRAQVANRPHAALEALAVIEEAASRTLSEMRLMVRTLREEGDRAEAGMQIDADTRTPAGTLADVERLVGQDASGLQIDVTREGPLDDLDAALGVTLHRLTREALTNAARHARGARRVSVRIIGEAACVRLRIVDDGHPVDVPDPRAGFGLRGMTERVALLGGTLQAGPRAEGGWCVEAVLPRRPVAP